MYERLCHTVSLSNFVRSFLTFHLTQDEAAITRSTWKVTEMKSNANEPMKTVINQWMYTFMHDPQFHHWSQRLLTSIYFRTEGWERRALFFSNIRLLQMRRRNFVNKTVDIWSLAKVILICNIFPYLIILLQV